MRYQLYNLAVLVLSSSLAPTAVFADVLCTFTTRSDEERTIGVRGPTYRIRPDGSHQILKVVSRGGGSYTLGRVIQVPA